MSGQEDSLSVDNTLWSNTVVASGSVLGVVIYTGPETRAVMNTNQPASKVNNHQPAHKQDKDQATLHSNGFGIL